MRPSLNSNPHEPADDLVIRVVGRKFGEAGKIEFKLAGLVIGSVVLPKLEWAVFAILAETAAKARNDSYFAFIRAQELADHLADQDVVALADATNAISTVFRLRKRIANCAVASATIDSLHQGQGDSDSEHDLGRELIKRNQTFGYRLDIHPDNLELDFPTIL